LIFHFSIHFFSPSKIGLFDNLFDKDIEILVSKHAEPITCAKSIADTAMRNSKDPKSLTPYAQSIRNLAAQFPEDAPQEAKHYIGGKLDDITCLVALVVTVEDDKGESTETATTAAQIATTVVAKPLHPTFNVGGNNSSSHNNGSQTAEDDELAYVEFMKCAREYETWTNNERRQFSTVAASKQHDCDLAAVAPFRSQSQLSALTQLLAKVDRKESSK
jgi:hypothetical protein